MKRLFSIVASFVGLGILIGVFILISLLLSIPMAPLFQGLGFPLHWFLSILITSLLFFVVSRFLPKKASSSSNETAAKKRSPSAPNDQESEKETVI
ncbi:MAG: hypothetical protein VX278_00345 [Myxococcota bacterium]|nr:hypothetical protein [Myxococcota bacterium]